MYVLYSENVLKRLSECIARDGRAPAMGPMLHILKHTLLKRELLHNPFFCYNIFCYVCTMYWQTPCGRPNQIFFFEALTSQDLFCMIMIVKKKGVCLSMIHTYPVPLVTWLIRVRYPTHENSVIFFLFFGPPDVCLFVCLFQFKQIYHSAAEGDGGVRMYMI